MLSSLRVLCPRGVGRICMMKNGLLSAPFCSSSSAPVLSVSLDASQRESVVEALKEAAEEGIVLSKNEIMKRLEGEVPEGVPLSVESAIDLLGTCKSLKVREFSQLAKLAERLLGEIVQGNSPGAQSPRSLIALAKGFSDLGVLNEPLMMAVAGGLLRGATSLSSEDLTQAARCFSLQHVRPSPIVTLFKERAREAGTATEGFFSKAQSISLFHSLANLRALQTPDELSNIEALFSSSASLESLSVEEALAVAHGYLLLPGHLTDMRARADDKDNVILTAVEKLCASPEASDPSFWGSRTHLHKRALVIRAALRYCYPSLYENLSEAARLTLRKMQKMLDLAPEDGEAVDYGEIKPVGMVNKLSWILGKLKVAHYVQARRGPFVFDVLERDRRLIWEISHVDRFYGSSFEKTASRQLQERIVKAMGYRVVHIPYWQWNRMKLRRTRVEYVRMSRYVAVRDVRERAPREVLNMDPTQFDAKSAALDPNSFQYLGEHIFKRTQTTRHFAWARHRVTGSLPTTVTM